MSGYEREPDHTWDEYEWERFLQQQDQKTEKYMELLEKYLDDPQRDQIIAREMGWTQSLGGERLERRSRCAHVEESARAKSDGRPRASWSIEHRRSFEDHGLYRAAFALTVWIDQLFDDDTSLQNEPAAVKLATHSALASAKLAAALSDEDVDEIGMTIAYLKRALKAITDVDGRRGAVARREIDHPRPSTPFFSNGSSRCATALFADGRISAANGDAASAGC